jgi:hypothetical protein
MNPGEYTFTNFLEQIMRHDTAAEIHSALWMTAQEFTSSHD